MKRLLLLTSLGLAACGADETFEIPESTQAVALESRVGSFLAEYESDSETAQIHAQFLLTRGITAEQALKALDVWSPDRELELDACSMQSVDQPRVESLALDLLDVGPIQVAYLDSVARLEGRRLPDMLEGVSGVVYGNERGIDSEWVMVPFVSGALYQISAPGLEAGGFETSILAPEIPVLIGPTLDETGTWSQSTSQALTLRWTAAEVSADRFYLEVATSNNLGARLVCRLEDDGEFTLPPGLLDGFLDSNRSVDVTLRRVNVMDIQMDGMDASEVVFVAKDRFSLSLQ